MQGQDVWTPNDSLKLKKMLEGKTEIQINKEALNELGKAFLPEKRLLNSHSAILPIEDFQMYKPDIFTGKYPKSTFKINGLNIWQDSLSMKIHLFSNKQLFINSQLDTGDSRVLIKRHTDTHVGLTNRLEYHIYSGYTIDKKRTVVLPTTATQYYIGTGFSYNINRKLQLKPELNISITLFINAGNGSGILAYVLVFNGTKFLPITVLFHKTTLHMLYYTN